MPLKFFGIVFSIIFFLGCKKDVPKYSLQYEVRKRAGNQSAFSIQFTDPSQATVSTGTVDTVLWQSALYTEVEDGVKYRIEVLVEKGNPSFDILVRKENSIIAKKEIRKSQQEYIIEGEM